MQAASTTIKDFYLAELAALRDEAVDFAGMHPSAARALGLNRQHASDPQAELLMQSFAYLTGRLRYQHELERAALPNALLGFLYPHLEAPLPSMLVAQVHVKPDGANFTKEQMLKRGRYVGATARNELGQEAECRFRTAYDTPLVSMRVDGVSLQSSHGWTLPADCARAHSVLRVRIAADGVGTLQLDTPQRLRFHLHGAERDVDAACRLYELLSMHLVAVGVQAQDHGTTAYAPSGALRWLGFESDEAMLEANPHVHPGYRLLQEYFAFREKFMFFELEQLDLRAARREFDLLLFLDTPPDPQLSLSPSLLRLNCVPLVNLFSQRIEPLALDQTRYEYRLQADLERHRYCEIYALQRLESTRQDGSTREIVPYFALDGMHRLETQDYFYVTRRECSRAGIAGSDMFVSFLDLHFDLARCADEVVGGRALCTNRRLPEQIAAGASLHLEGPGPVANIVALTKPTPHQTPDLVGPRPWALVSQLALNQLSLADGPASLAALKEILRLHVGTDRAAGLREIDGLSALGCRAIVKQVGRDGWRGFVRGMHVRVHMDRHNFELGSPVLFCSVLRHFFALYATVNNLVEVSLETQDIKGTPKQWNTLAGARTVL